MNVTKRGQKAVYKFVRRKMLSNVSVPVICNNNNALATNVFQSVFISEPHSNLPLCLTSRKETFLSDVNLTEEIIRAELIKIPEKSSPGPDSISSVVLKRCTSWIVGPLSHIMIVSFQTSVLPPVWLQTLITPVLI